MPAFAVIMAGGKGERLWPLSTPARPKQFIPLLGERSLLQLTLERIARLVPKERVLVVVPEDYASLAQEQTRIPFGQIFVEPSGKSTAPCLALAAFILATRQKNAVMIALPSDHVIRNEQKFLEILEVGVKTAEENEYLITLGIPPSYPATGYGYIRRGPLHVVSNGIEIYRALEFREKPDRSTAEKYVASGEYYWNSGMFIWRVDVFLKALEQHLPVVYAGLEQLRLHLGRPTWEGALRTIYADFPTISVDYGVMEKAQNVLVIPADIGWNDVGDWASLGDLFPCDENENHVYGSHIGVETHGCVIFAARPGHLIATLGLKDLVVVDTEEAILVLPKARAQEVRRILNVLFLKKRGEQ